MRTLAPIKAPFNISDPGSVVNSPAWLEWFQRMSDYYEAVSKWVDAGMTGGFGAIEPPTVSEGLLAYADGVNWDPGSGQGYYRYKSGVWVPVGGQGPSNTVVSEVAFGLPVIPGTEITFSRGDHSHGSPVNPMPNHLADIDPHPQYTFDTLFDDHHVQHENGGSDEISVAGLSGELADPQPPKSHGNGAHTSTFATEIYADGAVSAHVGESDPHTQYQKESEKDAAGGYAGLNGYNRTIKGVDTTDDLIVDVSTKGLVFKDSQATPHYWRLTITTLGVLITTDLGEAKP